MKLPDARSLLAALCAGFLALSFIPDWSFLAYVAVAAGAVYPLRSAYESLRARSIDVDVLMVLAAIGAIAVGHVTDAGILLFLFSLSGALEAFAMRRTRSAIEGLVKLRPATARLADGSTVPVESVRIDDVIVLPAYENVPLDGVVLEGQSTIDASVMTGESIPVAVGPGDKVIGGTQNMDGMLRLRVTATVGDSALDKIVALVQDAQENKASGERISAWFGQRYTVFVLAAFAIAFLVRWLALRQAPFDALGASVTLLVALSPCALVISTPATTLSALAWAARRGLLVRGGVFIERAGEIDSVALDKTGTLTTGRPELREICVCEAVSAGPGCGREAGCWAYGEEWTEASRHLLSQAAAVERFASHPVAAAVMRAAERLGVPVPEADGHATVPGLGVEATVDGRLVRMGQLRYLTGVGIEIPEGFAEHVSSLQRQGMTVAVLHSADGLAAFGFGDAVRSEARKFLESIHALGVRRVAMLTGDTHETAAAVANEVGIQEVHAGLLPEEKERLVAEMAASSKVLMVGDGINDAPSLARAHLGAAMGGLGSDIAMNAADVVLMRDRLDAIPDLIRLGRKTRRIIRANLVFAAGVIVALTVSSLFFRLPLPLAVLGHEGSTVLVILNGLRLLRGP